MAHAMGFRSFGPPGLPNVARPAPRSPPGFIVGEHGACANAALNEPRLRSGGRPACRRGGRPAPRNPRFMIREQIILEQGASHEPCLVLSPIQGIVMAHRSPQGGDMRQPRALALGFSPTMVSEPCQGDRESSPTDRSSNEA
jgi:hypothetical protein